MKKNIVSYEKVLIDGEYIDIPIALFNKRKRKTILITAGVDGDEYSGIEAAYKFIRDFSKLKCDYRVIVIPVLNIFGHKEGVSFNPKDGKYPKNIYPGKLNGSSSEQLIYFLDKYIKKSFIWIDLHSGAKDEKLYPFIWAWETKNKEVNNLLIGLLSNFKNDTIVYQKNSTKKIDELAKKNIAYLMLESGELGRVDDENVAKHIKWIKPFLVKEKINKNILVYRKVKFGKANKDGKWNHKISPGKFIKKGTVGNIDEKIFSTEGIILYIKKNKLVKKGEELFANAYDPELI